MSTVRRLLLSPEWVTVEELAAQWRMNPKTVSEMVRDGRVPGKKIGNRYIIPANVKRPEYRKRGRPALPITCDHCANRWTSYCQMYMRGAEPPDDWFCADGRRDNNETD